MRRGSLRKLLVGVIGLVGLVAVGLLGFAVTSSAQPAPPLGLPGERPEEIPIPEDRAAEAEGVRLVPAPEALPATALPPLRVHLRKIRIDGNSVLDAAELTAVARRYIGRELGTEDIEDLRRELSLLYVEQGYVTSGAVIPDQDLAHGTLFVQIVEGRIGELLVSGNQRFREAYLRTRILPQPKAPLEVRDLERRLQLLQADPQIQAVHAELRPGLRLGESVLRIRIQEARSYTLAIDTANHRSPAIGETTGRISGGLRNLAGWGDLAQVWGEFGEGLRDVRARYAIPVSRWNTQLALNFRWSDSKIVEEPFDAIDVESDFLAGGIELTQPLIHSLRDELRVGVLAEWRRGRNFVAGTGFSFSEGADHGVSTVVPLRPFIEWVRRDRAVVFAVRFQLSVGLPLLGYSNVDGSVEDGSYVAGLLQAQWAQRFDQWWGLEVVARSTLQLASQPLLPIEQFSIGGHASVRGYRENQVVLDNGFDAGLELRIPILRRPDGRSLLQLAPFGDVGHAWDHSGRSDSRSQTLGSVGVGVRWSPVPWLHTEAYWGYRIADVPNPHDSLQDHGLQLRVVGKIF